MIRVSHYRLWTRLRLWVFHCNRCHTAMAGYETAAQAADEGRAHLHRAHGCCSHHTVTCGREDWCCDQCPQLATIRALLDGKNR